MLYFNTNVGATLFRKALSDPSHPHPRVINTDQARLYGSAIPGVKKKGILRRRCRHRSVQYLNNILEQDHRAIKRRGEDQAGRSRCYAPRTQPRHVGNPPRPWDNYYVGATSGIVTTIH